MKCHTGPDSHQRTDIKQGSPVEIHVNAGLTNFVTFCAHKCQYAWI